MWRKWSLADGLVSGGPEPWIAVDKTVVKRRFSITGEEVVVRDLADLPDGPCCDVEVVAIGDRTEQAWSFAFAAHGPRRGRRASIGAAWHTLVSARRRPPGRRCSPPPGGILCGSSSASAMAQRWLSGNDEGTTRGPRS